MKNLNGKCKDCLGCNLLENDDFQGKNNCKYFIEINKKNTGILIALLIEVVIFFIVLAYVYLKYSMLCGG